MHLDPDSPQHPLYTPSDCRVSGYTRQWIKHALALSAVILATSLVFVAPAHSDIADLEQTEIPTSDAKQQRTLKLINYLIDKSHYRRVDLDDTFSRDILDAYLEQLDAAKSFFLASDIEQFSRLDTRFDDFIREGSLKPAFAMFSIFRARVEQRVEYALQRLDQEFDFRIDEDYELDREESNWATNEQELDDLWRKRIKNDILGLRLTDRDHEEIIETLKRRYTHIARRTRQFKSDDVFQTFINAYVTSIEPHTSYFSPRASENFKINMRLSLEGIGAVLQTDNEYTLVRRIVPGGPADMNGHLEAEDRIVGVGQENEEIVDVIGWRLDDVVELIRGPKSSRVRLEVLSGKVGLEGKTEIVEIVRDEIKLEEQAARKKLLEISTGQSEARIGLIELPSFYVDFDGMHSGDPDFKSTTRDVGKLLAEFNEENIDGLVIDLRGNGGGALTEAISLTGLFIDQGPVVQVESSDGNIQVDRDPNPGIAYDGPLVVMVDGYSASASEIFAGAIQDYRRGLIVGEPTFGKGTVQNLVNLSRFARNDGPLGQLKVTIAQFFRVNGDSTQYRGVIPDMIWPTADPDPEFGERSYTNAIPWRHIDQADYQPFEFPLVDSPLDQTRTAHEQRLQNDPEFKYYKEISNINHQRRNIESITLNETRRRLERQNRDTERLTLENNKRIALGKKPFEDIDAVEEFDKEKLAEPDANREPDAFVMESARILTDYIYFADITRKPGSNLAENLNIPVDTLNN